jgi:hypothetical protein
MSNYKNKECLTATAKKAKKEVEKQGNLSVPFLFRLPRLRG